MKAVEHGHLTPFLKLHLKCGQLLLPKTHSLSYFDLHNLFLKITSYPSLPPGSAAFSAVWCWAIPTLSWTLVSSSEKWVLQNFLWPLSKAVLVPHLPRARNNHQLMINPFLSHRKAQKRLHPPCPSGSLLSPFLPFFTGMNNCSFSHLQASHFSLTMKPSPLYSIYSQISEQHTCNWKSACLGTCICCVLYS